MGENKTRKKVLEIVVSVQKQVCFFRKTCWFCVFLPKGGKKEKVDKRKKWWHNLPQVQERTESIKKAL